MVLTKVSGDRVSNREWKERRNYIILVRYLYKANKPLGGIWRAVMETRSGLDGKEVKRLLDAIAEWRFNARAARSPGSSQTLRTHSEATTPRQ